MTPAPTPSQTVGPFFAFALPWPEGPYVVEDGTAGAVWLRGRVLDGADEPVPDALVESWQAGDEGRRFGRSPTDEEGRWALLTVKPPRVGGQAPHVDLRVFARGLLEAVVTRLYFGDEPRANADDPVLAALPEAERATLVAAPSGDSYTLDVHLQGPDETTFFAV
jgi:protocatechuate 3,4-dioxygenase, alpha subunit